METGASVIPRDVQCQRTRRYLPVSLAEGDTVACPWCPQQETYRRVEARDDAALTVASAIGLCRGEFGVDEDGLGTAVWLGDGPETVYEPHLQRYNVYLARDSDRWQIRYSGAHEAFHRVCSPGVGGHWGDEMFAVLFSLLYLDGTGESNHASLCEVQLTNEAAACAPLDFFTYSGGSVRGLYGRAFLIGRQLQAAVGWEMLKRLAVVRGGDGRVDIERWLTELSQAARTSVRSIVPP